MHLPPLPHLSNSRPRCVKTGTFTMPLIPALLPTTCYMPADASAFSWYAPPPERNAAKKANERMRNPGQPQQPAPALPEAAAGHHPIGLGPWGHEPSINVKMPERELLHVQAADMLTWGSLLA